MTARVILGFILLIGFFVLPKSIFAETSPYRSAGWIGSDGNPGFINLTNCQLNDGQYCSRLSSPSYGNLYFSSFGTLADFDIPQNAVVNKIHIRIKGKSSDILKLGVESGNNKMPLTNYCQNPFDLWWFMLGNVDTTREYHTTFSVYPPGNNLSNCFSPQNIDQQNFTFRINQALSYAWSADIDNFEIAFDYTLASTPTPTSTNTPTPSPTAVPTPQPFLDLPWNYEGKGMSFNDAALAINSYFDHEYPLLSSGLTDFLGQLTTFDGKSYPDSELGRRYSSHDGYDYARRSNVHLGDLVLAAAAGDAMYVDSCKPCGNAIHIDHSNGYQTRYYHLQKDGLIVAVPHQKVQVSAGQSIGKVGFTGNVDPQGKGGAHIHFMVVEDKNKDGNFEDNIPDGVTDPFGWQSNDPDPWESYTFFYNGQQRTGNKSYYLWKKKIVGLQQGLPANGGVFQVGKYTVTFPEDPTRPEIKLDLTSAPWEKFTNEIMGIGPSIDIVAKNLLGDWVKFFTKPITIQINFSAFDLARYDLGTTIFSIYSSEDGLTWKKEPTVIDLSSKTATTQVHHLTRFALMAQRRDTIAPTTTVTLTGEEGQSKWFRSNVQVHFNSEDNEGGLGVDHTLYKLDEEDWQVFTNTLTFTAEGQHSISFFSTDKDENIEEIQTITFTIDKTAPEAQISYDLANYDVVVTGSDSAGLTTVTVEKPNVFQPKYLVRDQAGNTLRLTTNKIQIGKQVALSIKSLQYNSNPLISLDKNMYFTLAIVNKINTLKQLDQYYSLRDDKRISTYYSALTDITKIYTKKFGSTGYTVETRSGVVLLKLITQNGTLKYNY